MTDILKVSLVQTALVWEDKKQNLALMDMRLAQLSQSDLIVLPEMFSTGFSMNTSFAETMTSETLEWMKTNALRMNTPICGSVMMQDENRYTNRFIWANPDNTIYHYDKRHLFRMGDEHQHFVAGQNRLMITYKGWKFFPVVCYDLRFPVWLRRTPEFDYDAMIVVANWPERRQHHWRTLLQARAIENQSYIIAVNRVGKDGNGVSHSGNTGIVSPKGEWLCEWVNDEKTGTITISKDELIDWRTSFPAQNDADEFILK